MGTQHRSLVHPEQPRPVRQVPTDRDHRRRPARRRPRGHRPDRRRPRETATVEADRVSRQAGRVDALAAKADKKHAAAEAAWTRHTADVERLPPGGEPIKLDHHSGARHRRDVERAHRSIGAAVRAGDDAEEYARRAAAATHTTGARHNPVTVANRIKALAADIRRLERQVVADTYDRETGYRPATDDEKEARRARLAPRIDQKRDQHAYWVQIRAEQQATGHATNYSPANVRKGDAVKIRGSWHRVARANQKSVSVETEYSWTDRAPWHEVQDHKPATL
ncbi:hypothetical protein GCM10025865_33770 (plasmid) [Paraoerskovia sediminicola]|uniref:DUF3560 domain-containing protein n=1 Tax=Paraoerskovia sediminicola TaxID=1138587 RepID=A0ABM8G7G2_9CELL|nr:DUF3560 domain-containing protein [Paraoerskovia sediminicola]BDZ44034.1 hypothetical protein GCM10025865_33330 [Paraoerskovia sediminicola]BDZ44078.1 hypothetical protein GCM10025865_33770 [Paraoerskovia sediminicola]